MIRAYIAIVFMLSAGSLYGQFGVSAKYQSIVSSHFAVALTELGVEYGYHLVGGSAFYWFRLKNRRVEFLPEIGYLKSLKSSIGLLETDLQKILVSFNTDIYLFDLEGDCNCPTFSKQSGYFQKGFFIEVTPGLDVQIIDLQNVFFDIKDYALTFRIGLGLGFDFGISDMLTITPTAGMIWSTGPRWYDVVGSKGGEKIFRAGLRATFRPDYKRGFR